MSESIILREQNTSSKIDPLQSSEHESCAVIDEVGRATHAPVPRHLQTRGTKDYENTCEELRNEIRSCNKDLKKDGALRGLVSALTAWEWLQWCSSVNPNHRVECDLTDELMYCRLISPYLHLGLNFTRQTQQERSVFRQMDLILRMLDDGFSKAEKTMECCRRSSCRYPKHDVKDETDCVICTGKLTYERPGQQIFKFCSFKKGSPGLCFPEIVDHLPIDEVVKESYKRLLKRAWENFDSGKRSVTEVYESHVGRICGYLEEEIIEFFKTVKNQEYSNEDQVEEIDKPEQAVETSCGHVFGEDCLREWINTRKALGPKSKITCPYCRQVLKVLKNGDSRHETLPVDEKRYWKGHEEELKARLHSHFSDLVAEVDTDNPDPVRLLYCRKISNLLQSILIEESVLTSGTDSV